VNLIKTSVPYAIATTNIKVKVIFLFFLFLIKSLKFNNVHIKDSNATKLTQIESSMHKGVQGLCFVAFGHPMQKS